MIIVGNVHTDSSLLGHSFLPPKECCVAAGVCRLWRGVVESDEHLWARHCAHCFAMTHPMDFTRQPMPTFRQPFHVLYWFVCVMLNLQAADKQTVVLAESLLRLQLLTAYI